MDAQMKKGVLELCLLHLIATRETYGYLLLGDVQAAFPGVKESTIYAVLRRLQTDGFALTHSGGQEASGGPARKYLRLTPEGEQALKEARESWRAVSAAVRALGIKD